MTVFNSLRPLATAADADHESEVVGALARHLATLAQRELVLVHELQQLRSAQHIATRAIDRLVQPT